MTTKKRRSTWKGERVQVAGRFPKDLHSIITAQAQSAGVSQGEWLVHLTSVALDMPHLDPVTVEDSKQMLMTG